MIESMIEARREGCDAIIHDWTLDASGSEAQQVLDIPVIRITEASLKYATLLGQTIGVVTMHERQAIIQYRRLIRRYGLDRFLSDKDPIRGVDITTEVMARVDAKNWGPVRRRGRVFILKRIILGTDGLCGC